MPDRADPAGGIGSDGELLADVTCAGAGVAAAAAATGVAGTGAAACPQADGGDAGRAEPSRGVCCVDSDAEDSSAAADVCTAPSAGHTGVGGFSTGCGTAGAGLAAVGAGAGAAAGAAVFAAAAVFLLTACCKSWWNCGSCASVVGCRLTGSGGGAVGLPHADAAEVLAAADAFVAPAPTIPCRSPFDPVLGMAEPPRPSSRRASATCSASFCFATTSGRGGSTAGSFLTTRVFAAGAAAAAAGAAFVAAGAALQAASQGSEDWSFHPRKPELRLRKPAPTTHPDAYSMHKSHNSPHSLGGSAFGVLARIRFRLFFPLARLAVGCCRCRSLSWPLRLHDNSLRVTARMKAGSARNPCIRRTSFYSLTASFVFFLSSLRGCIGCDLSICKRRNTADSVEEATTIARLLRLERTNGRRSARSPNLVSMHDFEHPSASDARPLTRPGHGSGHFVPFPHPRGHLKPVLRFLQDKSTAHVSSLLPPRQTKLCCLRLGPTFRACWP